MAQLTEGVIKVLAKTLGVEESEVTPDLPIPRDELTEIEFALEDDLDLEVDLLDDPDIESPSTAQGLMDFLLKRFPQMGRDGPSL